MSINYDSFKLIRKDGTVLTIKLDDAIIIEEYDDGELDIELLDTGEIIAVKDKGAIQ
jgi:hypothetical protein